MSATLTRSQVEQYESQGYLMLEQLLPTELVNDLRSVTEQLTARAAALSDHDDVFELEEGHTSKEPRVRRIKRVLRNDVPSGYEKEFGFFRQVATYGPLVDALTTLLGPDVRIQGGKLNAKPAGGGAPVEWHQDWAFYPHTNDDLLAVGIMLDDVDDENGPLLALPGSHTGPTFDHHHDGYFVGAIDVDAAGLDLSRAEALTGPAGSVTIHHVRIVHGSAPNTSPRPRRLLLPQYAASDAWPLRGCGDFDAFDAQIIAGEPTIEPRLVPTPIRMPLPVQPETSGSIFQRQHGAGKRYFAGVDGR